MDLLEHLASPDKFKQHKSKLRKERPPPDVCVADALADVLSHPRCVFDSYVA